MTTDPKAQASNEASGCPIRAVGDWIESASAQARVTITIQPVCGITHETETPLERRERLAGNQNPRQQLSRGGIVAVLVAVALALACVAGALLVPGWGSLS